MTPNTKLLKAVSEWSWLVAGCDASELRITLADGHVVSLMPPKSWPTREGEPGGASAGGWRITEFSAEYRGVGLDLGSKKRPCLAMLRMLVGAEGAEVPMDEVKMEVWPGYEPEPKTIANTISTLRTAIRAAVEPDDDPITDFGDRIRLNVN